MAAAVGVRYGHGICGGLATGARRPLEDAAVGIESDRTAGDVGGGQRESAARIAGIADRRGARYGRVERNAVFQRIGEDRGEQADQERAGAEEIRRFDQQRKDKRVPNDEWVSKTDPDSRIAKMKDGRTHLAYKAEHVVDLKTELVLAASIRPADEGDADTMVNSIVEARVNLLEAGVEAEIEEAVADKAYNAVNTIELAESLGICTYIPERKMRGARKWRDVPEEKRRAFLNNHRRVQARGASVCSGSGANWWSEVSLTCAARAARGEVGCMGSKRSKNAT